MSVWRTLLETAVHIPSPHNVQPWRVKIIDEENAELYIDSTRTLPKEDITGSFIISTMGMFIEALDILAGHNSLEIEYELFHPPEWFAPAILEPRPPWLIPFSKLKLVPGNKKEIRYDNNLFFKRRTSRLHLQDKLASESALDELGKIAGEFNQKFIALTDSEQIESFMEMNTDALFEDLNSPDYHDEIAEWFRYTNSQARKHLDGLDARCMNTSPVNFWLVANLPRLLLLPVSRQIMAKIYRRGLGKIPTLGVIAGGFWKPSDGIKVGRFLMRFWLETALHDLYIHPYGNLVTNKRIAAKVEKELGITDIWLIFKIGYSAEPPKSHRLPVERILV